jgi:hypothetical protein
MENSDHARIERVGAIRHSRFHHRHVHISHKDLKL